MTSADNLSESEASSVLEYRQPVEAVDDGATDAVPMARPLDSAPTPPRPWGFWATLGWSLAVMALFFAAQAVVIVGAILLAKAREPGVDIRSLHVETNGLVLSIAAMVSAPLCIGLIVLLIRVRRYPIGEYLGFELPGVRTSLKWLAVTVGFVGLQDLTSWLTGRHVVSPFMIEIYKTAGFVPLLLLFLVVAAPLFEELFFRGFMFHGIACSRAGAVTAILLTSLVWAAIHVQYDLWGIGWILLTGVLFGIARARTRSVILTILLHAILNIGATVEMLIHMRMTA